MKKKIITFILLIAVLLAGVVGIGCSKQSCTYNCYDKCGSCGNCIFQKTANFFDCTRQCFPNCLLDDLYCDKTQTPPISCYQDLCIDSCYICGNTIHSNCKDKAMDKIFKDLDKISTDDYYYSTKTQINDSGSKYYKILIDVEFSAEVDLKDVVLRVYVKSGDNSTYFVAFVGNLKAGKTYSCSETVTFKKTAANTIGAIDVTLSAYGK